MVKDILWLHQAIKMVINEMDSNVNIGYPKELIDIVINKASIKWLVDTVSGLESTQAIVEKLSCLVIMAPVPSTATTANSFQVPIAPTQALSNAYEYQMGTLALPYFQYLSAYVSMTKGSCEKSALVKIEQHDDIRVVLRDQNRKPSWRYGEVVGVFGRDSKTYTNTTANTVSKSIVLYTEKGSALGNMYLTYLKVPNQACYGGYNDLNGNALTRVELDIPQEYYPDIVEYAKQEVAATYGFTNNK